MAALAASKPPRDMRHRKIPGGSTRRIPNVRRREIPLAVVMVALTTLTLWSLGQALIVEAPAAASAAAPVVPGEGAGAA
jgi:hypothetical protein